LSPQSSPRLRLLPKAIEESTASTSAGEPTQDRVTTVPSPRVDWDDALAISSFYGRERELAQLTQWVVSEQCRVVSVLGMGGIGKSAVAISLMHELVEGADRKTSSVSITPFSRACPFEVVIFRSLRDAPSCETLLDECLQVLSPQSSNTALTTPERRMSL